MKVKEYIIKEVERELCKLHSKFVKELKEAANKKVEELEKELKNVKKELEEIKEKIKK